MNLDDALRNSDTTMPEGASPLPGILGLALLPVAVIGMATAAARLALKGTRR